MGPGDGLRQRVSHYRILGRLGAGGMGEVYSAFDETLKRRVALKAIRAEHRLNDEAKARFIREARLLSQLDHPHVCRAYDYIEDGDAEWLVLELVEGKDLRASITAGLDAAARFRVAEQMTSVLVAAHAAGVVHRDLKPGNVMLTERGDVKVLDFGLAHAIDVAEAVPQAAFESAVAEWTAGTDGEATQTALPRPEASSSRAAAVDAEKFHTQAGAISGTVAYMSPEQAVGSPATTASDMYSFGLLLQELFTGSRPYDATLSPPELLERARRGESLEPTGLSGDLAALIRRLKAMAPSQRPTALDTLERLRWIRETPARRLRWLAAAALLVAVSLGAAKYTLDLSRERTAAVAARGEADRRRDQAESLIGFLLGDLRKKLEPVGRLDILDDVGARAMDYFAAVPESALTDEELLRRSKALYQIGEVRIAQGDLEAALAPLEESLQLSQALLQRAPDDGERIFELAQGHYWVGYVHWRRRELEPAQRQFQAYLDAAERLTALAPSRRDWRQEVAYANSNIASVLEASGDLDGALARYRASLAIEAALLAGAPDDADLIRSVASSHNAIAVVRRSSGDLEGAGAEFAAERAILERMAAAEPANATWQHRLAVNLNLAGELLAVRGQRDAARAQLERALALTAALVDRDGGNSTWRRELARNEFKLGRLLIDLDPARAVSLTTRAAGTLRALAEKDPTNAGWQRDWAEARYGVGVALLARGDAAGARREADATVAMAERLRASTAPSRADDRLASLGHTLLGRTLQARGDRMAARQSWERALALIDGHARTPRDYLLLEVWAEALVRLDRSADAGAALDLLRRIGYKPGRSDSPL
jgi:eukaryotic-like serine/threonine-protein kinase